MTGATDPTNHPDFEPKPPEGPPKPIRFWSVLAGWFLALVAENLAGIAVLLFYGWLRLGGPGIPELLENPAGFISSDTLLALTAVLAPVGWAWLWFYRTRVQRRGFFDLGLNDPRAAGRLLLASLTGLAAPGLLLVAGLLFGVYRWDARSSTGLLFGAGLVTYLAFAASIFFLQASTEELLLRGFTQRGLLEWRESRSHAREWALLLPSLLFSLGHVANEGFGPIPFVNTALAGVLLGALTLRTGSLWVAFGAHAGWNLGLSVIWSLPVSGITTKHLLPIHTGSPNGDIGVWWGGAYGPEGGLAMTLLMAALLSLVLPELWGKDESA